MQRVFSDSVVKLPMWVGVLAIGLAVITPVEAGYVRPSLEGELFHNERLTLDVGQRDELATDLAALVRNFPDSAADTPSVQARAVAIALRLDHDNRDAITANGTFARGLPATAVTDAGTFTEMVGRLDELALYLTGDAATEEDKKLGVYLLDLSWRVKPQGVGGRAYEVLMQSGDGADWARIIDPAVDEEDGGEDSTDDGVSPFGKFEDDPKEPTEADDKPDETPKVTPPPKQVADAEKDPKVDLPDGKKLLLGNATITTMVSAPAMGFMPEATTVSVKSSNREWKWVKKNAGGNKGKDKKNNKGGMRWVPVDAKRSLGMVFAKDHNFPKNFTNKTNAGLRELKKSYNGWPTGMVAEVNAVNYGQVSGSLGALAAVVAIDSMVSGVEISPMVAYVGSFNEQSGKLIHHTEVATVLLRLDPTDLEKVKRLVVPMDGSQLYADILASVDPEMALRIEVIGAESVSQATRLGVTATDEKEKLALAEFAKIQKLQMRFDEKIRNKHIHAKLKEIVELMPNHLSAQALIMASMMPPSGKIQLPEDRAVKVLVEMVRPFGHMVDYDLDAISASAAKAEIELFSERLYKTRRRMDRGVSEAVTIASDFAESFKAFVTRKNRTSAMAQQSFDKTEELYNQLKETLRESGGNLR